MQHDTTSRQLFAKLPVICGCRVRLTHIDAEEGYTVDREGVVVTDLEPMFFKP